MDASTVTAEDASIGAIKRPTLEAPGTSEGLATPSSLRGSRPASRRGSGTIPGVSGHSTPFHSHTDLHEPLPHASKDLMAGVLRKYESLFTLTPQRMRMIVDAFEEVLERGLQEHGQTVVSTHSSASIPGSTSR